MNNKDKITKNMKFAELIEKHPELAEKLIERGMHCIGCPAAMHETLEQGCLSHGIDADEVVKEMNNKLKKNNKIDENLKEKKRKNGR